MVAGAATDAIVGDFRRAVASALEQGTTLRDFRQQFDDIVARHGWVHNGAPAWRARVIYETNLSTAYSAGRYAQQTAPDTLAVYPYWQYVHSGAAHPRLQHQAWNGLTLLATDSFWRTHYPPNGWRCGCRVRVLSARGLARQGKSGPDQTPVIETRRWVNPRTGEVHYVPIGIDPGFDYNPGLAWRGEAAFPDATVTRPPPGRWPPPAPARLPPPEAEPFVRPGAPIVPAEDFAAWAEGLIESRRADGSARVLGGLSDQVMQWLAARDAAPVSPALGITSGQLLHLVRDSKASAGRGLPLADVKRLPEIVRRPRAVLRERETGAILLVFDPSDGANSRAGKLIVEFAMNQRLQQGGERRRVLINAVKSGGLVEAAQLRARGLYELIEGEL
nr:phage minor head protein [Plastoroseomonas hellenica]